MTASVPAHKRKDQLLAQARKYCRGELSAAEALAGLSVKAPLYHAGRVLAGLANWNLQEESEYVNLAAHIGFVERCESLSNPASYAAGPEREEAIADICQQFEVLPVQFQYNLLLMRLKEKNVLKNKTEWLEIIRPVKPEGPHSLQITPLLIIGRTGVLSLGKAS